MQTTFKSTYSKEKLSDDIIAMTIPWYNLTICDEKRKENKLELSFQRNDGFLTQEMYQWNEQENIHKYQTICHSNRT